MWQALRVLPREGSQDADAVELMQSTSRSLIVITSAIYLGWCVVANIGGPQQLGWDLAHVTTVVVLASAISLWLVDERPIAAQAVWLAGISTAITISLYLFKRPEIAFSYTLLPLMAGITVGGIGAIAAELLVVGLVWQLARVGLLPSQPAYGLSIVSGGAIGGVLALAATRALFAAVQWSHAHWVIARKNLDTARYHQSKLTTTLRDLDRAHERLQRANAALVLARKAAEDAERVKAQFVTNVSHELRTPLNLIIGFADIVLSSPDTYGSRIPPALLADMGIVYRNAKHLSDLIDDVLDLSQVEAGRMALSLERACLSDVIENATMGVRPLFEAKGLYLNTEVPSDLPAILCDRTRVRQVVINLLSNAGRFTQQGGVRIRAHRDGNCVVVSVADTGPGIAPGDEDRVFRPFEQLDGSIRRRHGGSGLGLAISRCFVKLHGGKIWFESEPGAGTTFHFRLPLEPPTDEAAQRWLSSDGAVSARAVRSDKPATDLQSRLILLDDEGSLRRLITRYLSDMETVPVRDLREALTELSRMPAQTLVINATSVTEILEDLGRSAILPDGALALVCSVPGMHTAADALGVSDYFVKPVSRAALLATLDRLNLQGKTILIVDDQVEELRLFRRMLASSERGYRVLRARDGADAMTILGEQRPDALILDLAMLGMNGFQLLEAKSQEPALRDIPIIVVSARDPMDEPMVSSAFAVTKGGGLSIRQLLDCIRVFTELLSPVPSPARPMPIGTPSGQQAL